MVTAIENGIMRLEACVREEVRLRVVGVLSRITRRYQQNLYPDEASAILSLRDDDKVVVLSADNKKFYHRA